MGAPMAGHLQKAGYDLRVYNRTKSKAQELIDNGAVWCDSPAEAAEGADVIFTIVGFPPDVEDVILGDQGVLSKAKQGAIICDMTTSEPSLAEKIHAAAKGKGVGALDAPVSGGDTGAKQGTLAIMVGGDTEDFERVLPLFEIMGKTIKHIGPAGAGQHCKMVNQILIAGTMQGIAEALTYGKAAELDMETVLSVVSTGAAGSSCLTNLGPRVLEGDFEPGFIIEHFVKDMGIAIKEAKANDLDLPALELGKQRYDKVIEEGMGRKGTQALAKSTAKANNVNM
jgi:3-hydroxyisobutyrate dehydrogenase